MLQVRTITSIASAAIAVSLCGAIHGRAVSLSNGRAQTADVASVLAAAREALGGEKRQDAVRTFVATGRTRQVRGENLVPIEFEIAVELPDKYVRRDEIPAQDSGPTSVGFNGDALIQIPVPVMPPGRGMPSGAPASSSTELGAGRAGGPPIPGPAQLEAAQRARTTGVKEDFARLTLGMFAASFSGYPLTFSYAAEAEAPQGKADVLDVKGRPTLPRGSSSIGTRTCR
jgi:hypothetical protein